MEKLIKDSIPVDGNTVAHWPCIYNEREKVVNAVAEVTERYDNSYCIMNDTIGYVYNHEYYVTPYSGAAMKSISDAHLLRAYFFVPFSHGDYPQQEELKRRWFELKEKVGADHT